MDSHTLPRPSPDVVFQPVPDGAVLLATQDEVYYGLNEVGARIWALLPPETRTLPDMLTRMAQAYPQVERETLRADVVEMLGELEHLGLVTRARRTVTSGSIDG